MMLLTEAEAKEKWCPLARVVEIDDSGDPLTGFPVGNRAANPQYAHPSARCIGSACMAWRTVTSYRGDTNEQETRGFCGAFGHPPGAPL